MLLSTPDIAKPTKLVPPEHAGRAGKRDLPDEGAVHVRG